MSAPILALSDSTSTISPKPLHQASQTRVCRQFPLLIYNFFVGESNQSGYTIINVIRPIVSGRVTRQQLRLDSFGTSLAPRKCSMLIRMSHTLKTALRLAGLSTLLLLATASPAAISEVMPKAESPSARLAPETRLRKLHLVRPDLIPYPVAYEVYC